MLRKAQKIELICTFQQSFIWPLARPATPEETIIIELRQQTTKILFKTGTSSSSSSGSSRGTISSSSKVIGQYAMLMQGKLICFSSFSNGEIGKDSCGIEFPNSNIRIMYKYNRVACKCSNIYAKYPISALLLSLLNIFEKLIQRGKKCNEKLFAAKQEIT